VIPDEEQWTPGPGPYCDADGCRLFPGGHDWTSDPKFLGADSRFLHCPFTLGCIDQFELTWDCHLLQTLYELEEEEKMLRDMAVDPLVGEVARDLLDGFPANEIAFEADLVGPLERLGSTP
jgi:hypothetical protein